MSLEIYPSESDDPKPIVGIKTSILFHTKVTPKMSGGDTTEKVWRFPRYMWEYNYRMSLSDASEFMDFFINHQGSDTAFDVIDLLYINYENAYVGIGDGTTTVFDLPGVVEDPPAIYV